MNENQKKESPSTAMTPVSLNYFDQNQFEAMQRVCQMFVNSDLVPEAYKASQKVPVKKAMANTMIALDVATRIGANPLMVMQNLVVIYGRPSWSSQFLISTVNTCGRFNPLKFRTKEKGMLGMVDYNERIGGRLEKRQFDGRQVMDIECVAWTTAKGSDDILESAPISIRMAILEGWYTKPGSKWQTMATQMLMYRAAAFWTRVYAPELSMGMHTQEELRDIVDADYEEMSVSQQVEQEKAANANKEEIGIDDEEEPQQDAEAPQEDVPQQEEKVDTETGEVTPPTDGTLPLDPPY